LVVAPAGQDAPPGQDWHVAAEVAPSAEENWPAAHVPGATPAAQKRPAGHVTTLLLAPPGQNLPALHARHTDAELAEVEAE